MSEGSILSVDSGLLLARMQLPVLLISCRVFCPIEGVHLFESVNDPSSYSNKTTVIINKTTVATLLTIGRKTSMKSFSDLKENISLGRD